MDGLVNRPGQRTRLAAIAMAGIFAATGAAANAARASGSVSVTTTVSGCTFTVGVTWSGFQGGRDTLEVFLLQVFPPTNDGVVLEPSVYVQPVKGKGGSVSVTLPAIAASTTTNSFRAGAQLLDQMGVPISPSTQLSDVVVAYCNGF